MCRSRSCFGSTVLGESVIKSVPFAVFGNASCHSSDKENMVDRRPVQLVDYDGKFKLVVLSFILVSY